MPEFLTDEWLAHLDAAVRRSPDLAMLGAARPIVIEQVVGDVRLAGSTAPTDVVYRLTCDAHGARVKRVHEPTGSAPASETSEGSEPAAMVRIECDHATAVALARGEANAQEALARGTWRISGDIAALGAQADLLGRLGDVFVELRATTSLPGDAP